MLPEGSTTGPEGSFAGAKALGNENELTRFPVSE